MSASRFRDFQAPLLELLLEVLEAKCPAPQVDPEKLSEERGRLEMARAQGRRDVYLEVAGAIRMAAPVPESIAKGSAR